MSQIIADTLKLIADNQDVILSAMRLAATNKEITMATLKISDLSVGDWVKVRLNKCDYDDPETLDAKVLWIEGNSVGYDNSGIVMSAFVEDLYPIPITAEILEKSGWSTDGMYAFLRIDEHRHLEYYYHEHKLRKYYCGVDEWQNHAKVNDITFAVHCYSVHQLQHAMRLAGVDKEINL